MRYVLPYTFLSIPAKNWDDWTKFFRRNRRSKMGAQKLQSPLRTKRVQNSVSAECGCCCPHVPRLLLFAQCYSQFCLGRHCPPMHLNRIYKYFYKIDYDTIIYWKLRKPDGCTVQSLGCGPDTLVLGFF